MAGIKLSADFLLEVMQSGIVRAALSEKARQMDGEFDSVLDEADYDDQDDNNRRVRPREEPVQVETWVSEGTRPGGRPYARLSAAVDDTRGNYRAPKIRALRRLAARHSQGRVGDSE